MTTLMYLNQKIPLIVPHYSGKPSIRQIVFRVIRPAIEALYLDSTPNFTSGKLISSAEFVIEENPAQKDAMNTELDMLIINDLCTLH